MRRNLVRQGIHPTGVVREAEVDVPSVLLFEPVVKRHTLHHEEGNERGDADERSVPAALGKNSADLRLHEEIEGKVAAARLPRPARMDRLRSMFGSRAFIFAGEKIDLHLDRLAADRDGAMEDERLSRILFVASPQQESLDRLVARFL